MPRKKILINVDGCSRLEKYQFKQAAKTIEILSRTLSERFRNSKTFPKSPLVALRRVGISPRHGVVLLDQMSVEDPVAAAAFWFMLGWHQSREQK